MRKLGLALTTLAVSLAVLWGSAAAAQARSFTVLAVQQGDGHGDRNSFVFHERLFAKNGEHVGRNRVEFTREGRRSFHVKALFRFQGGKIRVAGPLSRGTTVLPITGGKGRYHGISGRLVVKEKENFNRETFHFSL
jgi:hypothetical protein